MGKLSGPRSFFPVEWEMVDLLAKAHAYAGIKASGVKTTVITSAIFAVGVFNLKKKKHEQMQRFVISARKSSDVLQLFWGYCWVDIHWSRIAKSLRRLRTRALGSLAGFPMYAHYEHISAIPTYTVY